MRSGMAYVVVRDKNGEVLLKTELSEAVVVGRSRECGIAVRDPRVSREHCRLEPWGPGWRVKDLGSHNRTYVNGRAATEQVLEDGDVIEVGKDKISFYTGKLGGGRVRAADPVMAGLADAESAVGKKGKVKMGGRSESSLFATRVMVEGKATMDESGIMRAQGAGSKDVKRRPVGEMAVVKGSKRWWAVVGGAVGVAAILVVAWLAH
jgi:hypothetical protein